MNRSTYTDAHVYRGLLAASRGWRHTTAQRKLLDEVYRKQPTLLTALLRRMRLTQRQDGHLVPMDRHDQTAPYSDERYLNALVVAYYILASDGDWFELTAEPAFLQWLEQAELLPVLATLAPASASGESE